MLAADRLPGTKGDEPAAPGTTGVTVAVLATVDLAGEIEGMAGRQLRMRMVSIEAGTIAAVEISVDIVGQ